MTRLDDAEIGFPAWVFGMSRYVFLDDGRIVCVVTRDAVDALHLLDPRSGALEPLDLAWTAYSTNALAAGEGRVVYAAASPVTPPTLVALDVATGREELLRRSLEIDLERDVDLGAARDRVSDRRRRRPPTPSTTRPTSAEWEGPPGERPPLRVICHGGPTGHTDTHLVPRRPVLHAAWDRRRRRQPPRQHGIRTRVPPAARRPVGRDRLARLRCRGALPRRARRCRSCAHVGRGRERRRLRRPLRADVRAARVRRRRQPLRRRGRGGARARHAQVRVALHGLVDRPLSGAGRSLP